MEQEERLEQDLRIIERMLQDVGAYLRSDTLFYPTGPRVPELTFGGLLMRQNRLLLLRALLDEKAQARLDQTVADLHRALDENVVRFEQKAQQEMEARFRQWREYLRDLHEDKSAFNYYATAVEPRVMIDVLASQMELAPYKLTSNIPERIVLLDQSLLARWEHGDFVWPDVYQSAYPQTDYWYLYGRVT